MLKPFARFYFIVVFLLLPLIGFSQKLEKPVIDQFSNDTTKRTTMERIGAVDSFSSPEASYLNAGVTKAGGVIFLDIELDATTINNYYFPVSNGDNLLLKLADNSVIKLTNSNNINTHKSRIKHGFIEREYFIANMAYAITNFQIDNIMASDVVAVRVETDNGHFDFDIKPKGNAILKKTFKLIRSK